MIYIRNESLNIDKHINGTELEWKCSSFKISSSSDKLVLYKHV